MAASDAPRCVMAVRFSALGDVAMTVPALYGACRANPDVRFVMVTRRRMAPLFVNPPSNLTVHPVDLDHWRGARGMWRLMRMLHGTYRPDTLVDLHDVLRTRLMSLAARLLGMRVTRMDKQRSRRRSLLRHGTAPLPDPVPQRYADALQAAGLQRGDAFTSVYGGRRADPALFASVTAPPGPGTRWVAVAPFAAHAGKRLPLPLVRGVVKKLLARGDTRVFAMGFGPEEEAAIDSLAPEAGDRLVNMARVRAGLGAELALLSHCSAMVSADSANMHLASLAGLPAVTVWGATHPDAGFLGYGQRREDCVQADMDCRPCSVFGNRPCRRTRAEGSFPCLEALAAEAVYARIAPYLARK